MEHGGDLISYRHHYHGELIDFSSNINPLGPPKGLDEKLMAGMRSLTSYPDIKYRKLKKALSSYLRCGQDHILVGNGAVEIIDDFIIAARSVVVMIPSFSEYEKRALVHGKGVKRLSYKGDFSIDRVALKDTLSKGDLLILGSPNNPTGLRIGKEELMDIYRLTREKGAYLLLDEAFYEFCPKDYDSIELFKSKAYEGVGIIRAATKFFGLPGIRLGYGCAAKDKARQLKEIGLPWSVNCLADIAGQFIFRDRDYIDRSKAYIEQERKYLLGELAEIDGIKPYKSHSNYILIKLLIWDEDSLFHKLLTKGIMVRKCSSFTGLSKDHIRVAIKDRKSNEMLVEALKSI